MEYVLAVDQGTHASRALVFDGAGAVVAKSLHPVSLARPRPAWLEQDAEQIVQSVHSAIDDSLQALTPQQRSRIGACGITTQRSTVTAWLSDGTLLAPAINWQDTRGAAQIERLRDRAAAIRKVSGLPLSAHYGASKLNWLTDHLELPANFRFGPLAGFLLLRLTGGHSDTVDHSNAQRMQLFDIRTLSWSAQLADWFQVPIEHLPACKPVCRRYGSLARHAIPVTAVCGDQNAAWFGSGAPARDTALINLGSGAFILAGNEADVGDPDLLTSIACSDQQGREYLLEGTVNGAGNALQWLKKQRQLEDLEGGLSHWIEQAEAPPLFMNTVGGLGSPWWREGLEPRFTQGTENYSDAELVASVVESILFLIQYNLERIGKHRSLTGLRLSGGLSQLAPLCQKLANLSGLPIVRCDDPEASARGVAWLAAGRPPAWRVPGPLQHFQPRHDAGLTRRYTLFIRELKQYIKARQDD
ncbi:FGGY family carbohydrate kinase [Thiogranum longum]